MQKMVFVTGGAGYIGSHTVVALSNKGYDVVILDNLSNSEKSVIDRLQSLCTTNITFIQGDIRDRSLLQQIFTQYPSIQSVIHFAALKAVGESVVKPILYYDNNVVGSLILIEEIIRHHIPQIIFSSSATVYQGGQVPFKESSPTGAGTSPYGDSKYFVEKMYHSIQQQHPDLSLILLRYFNPIGAHPSALIGENPNGIPNNLLPYICQVAAGQRPHLNIFGHHYPTPDGTGVRDYIHVMDLADGHIAAMTQLGAGTHIYNLGTGQGYSVLEMIHAFERVNHVNIPYQFVAPRAGDVAISYADPQRAQQDLHWSAQYQLDDMVYHTWQWQKHLMQSLTTMN